MADINKVAGQLEIDTDHKDLWQNLFEKVEKLPTAQEPEEQLRAVKEDEQT